VCVPISLTPTLSPARRERTIFPLLDQSNAMDCNHDGRRFSLSHRERAAVRGKAMAKTR
jgi:hypothetical protein